MIAPPASVNAGGLVLVAASCLSMVLGSVHGFSVFLEPMEQQFGASRSSVALTYSIALVFLTFAVLLGHRIYNLCRSAVFVTIVCLLGAFGLALAGLSQNLVLVWLGYGVIFGLANGMGYGFGLQIAAQANPRRSGLAMGTVTASYALGAALASPLFAYAVDIGGLPVALLGLGFVLLLCIPASGGLMALSGFQYRQADPLAPTTRVSLPSLMILWAAYGCAIAAGLMVIGHAAGILAEIGWTSGLWVAPLTIALLNLIGSLLGGGLSDRSWLFGMPVIYCFSSAMALFLLIHVETGGFALAALGIVGLTYGALIASFPAMILRLYGVENSAKIYGRVFTAWGAFGLLGPWLAGYLYDKTASYDQALYLAALFSAVSIVFLVLFSRIGRSAH